MSRSSSIELALTDARIGFAGLGKIGRPIATRLVQGGFAVVAYDIQPAAVESFQDETHARGAATLEELGSSSDVVVLSLPTSETVATVVLGEDGRSGLSTAMAPGSLVIDMGSSNPLSTRRVAAALGKMGIELLDAPVSGGVRGALEGTLTMMVGGRVDLIEWSRPLLETVASRIIEAGPIGSAHALKALNNLLSAAGMLITSEAFVVGRRLGLDPHVMLRVLNASSGRNYATEAKFDQFVLSRTFDSGFSLELMLKDVTTAVELAREVETDMPFGEACRALWAAARTELGDGADHTEIARWLEESPEEARLDAD